MILKTTKKMAVFFHFGLLFQACEKSGEPVNNSSPTSQLTVDSDLSVAVISSSLSESLESLSDTNLSSSSSNQLSLEGHPSDNKFSSEKSCATSGNTAIVTLKRIRSHSWENKNKNSTLSASMSATNELIKNWSKPETAIACNGKSAVINFEADLTGLKLDVKVDRAFERSFERVIIKTGKKTTSSSKSSTKGTRTVEWLSQTNNEDGTVSRIKNISFVMNRKMDLINKAGEKKALDLKLETKAAAPLNIIATWNKFSKHRSPLSKMIKSGTIKATKAGDGYSEANYNNLLLNFSDNECVIYSGTMEIKVYAEGKTVPSKTYLLTAADGQSITVEDITDISKPVAVEEFDYSPCDLKEFQE